METLAIFQVRKFKINSKKLLKIIEKCAKNYNKDFFLGDSSFIWIIFLLLFYKQLSCKAV